MQDLGDTTIDDLANWSLEALADTQGERLQPCGVISWETFTASEWGEFSAIEWDNYGGEFTPCIYTFALAIGQVIAAGLHRGDISTTERAIDPVSAGLSVWGEQPAGLQDGDVKPAGLIRGDIQ